MKIISKIIYGILGGILLAGGFIGLFNPTLAIPNAAEISASTDENVLNLAKAFIHILKETGAAAITLAVLHLWGIFNFQKMSQLNYILLLFWIIMAGIHFYEFAMGNRTITSPLINSIPTVLMIMVILFRKKIDA